MSQYDVNAYKFDSRTKEKFISDMEDGLAKEVKAIQTFRDILKNSFIECPEVVYVGSQEEGKVIYNGNEVANVDVFPDYLLKHKICRSIAYSFIEVKICNPRSPYAYFKKKQMEQYKNLDKILILFVMGASTNDPTFMLVSPKQILNMGIEPEVIYGKETFKCSVDLFGWEKFKPIKRKYSVIDKTYIKDVMK